MAAYAIIHDIKENHILSGFQSGGLALSIDALATTITQYAWMPAFAYNLDLPELVELIGRGYQAIVHEENHYALAKDVDAVEGEGTITLVNNGEEEIVSLSAFRNSYTGNAVALYGEVPDENMMTKEEAIRTVGADGGSGSVSIPLSGEKYRIEFTYEGPDVDDITASITDMKIVKQSPKDGEVITFENNGPFDLPSEYEGEGCFVRFSDGEYFVEIPAEKTLSRNVNLENANVVREYTFKYMLEPGTSGGLSFTVNDGTSSETVILFGEPGEWHNYNGALEKGKSYSLDWAAADGAVSIDEFNVFKEDDQHITFDWWNSTSFTENGNWDMGTFPGEYVESSPIGFEDIVTSFFDDRYINDGTIKIRTKNEAGLGETLIFFRLNDDRSKGFALGIDEFMGGTSVTLYQYEEPGSLYTADEPRIFSFETDWLDVEISLDNGMAVASVNGQECFNADIGDIDPASSAFGGVGLGARNKTGNIHFDDLELLATGSTRDTFTQSTQELPLLVVGGDWSIAEDNGNYVLKESSGSSGTFDIAVLPDPIADGVIETRMKWDNTDISTVRPGAGIIFGEISGMGIALTLHPNMDSNAAIMPDNTSIWLSTIPASGMSWLNTTKLATADLPDGFDLKEWHTLRTEIKEDPASGSFTITAYVDGVEMLTLDPSSFPGSEPIAIGGRPGLITGFVDGNVYFDDFMVASGTDTETVVLYDLMPEPEATDTGMGKGRAPDKYEPESVDSPEYQYDNRIVRNPPRPYVADRTNTSPSKSLFPQSLVVTKKDDSLYFTNKSEGAKLVSLIGSEVILYKKYDMSNLEPNGLDMNEYLEEGFIAFENLRLLEAATSEIGDIEELIKELESKKRTKAEEALFRVALLIWQVLAEETRSEEFEEVVDRVAGTIKDIQIEIAKRDIKKVNLDDITDTLTGAADRIEEAYGIYVKSVKGSCEELAKKYLDIDVENIDKADWPLDFMRLSTFKFRDESLRNSVKLTIIVKLFLEIQENRDRFRGDKEFESLLITIEKERERHQREQMRILQEFMDEINEFIAENKEALMQSPDGRKLLFLLDKTANQIMGQEVT